MTNFCSILQRKVVCFSLSYVTTNLTTSQATLTIHSLLLQILTGSVTLGMTVMSVHHIGPVVTGFWYFSHHFLHHPYL